MTSSRGFLSYLQVVSNIPAIDAEWDEDNSTRSGVEGDESD